MDDLASATGEILDACMNRGMELPFVMVAVAANSSIYAHRYEEDETGDGLDVVPLAEHIVGPGFQLPINMMLVDATGEAVRIVIGREGGATFH